MKKVWITTFMVLASTSVAAQSTIYKHVDAVGRVTYSNKPIKDGVVIELEPLTTIPASPMGKLQPQPGSAAAPASEPAPLAAISPVVNLSSSAEKPKAKPAVAIVTPLASNMTTSLASVDTQTQKRRDEGRRRILEDELGREQKDLEGVRKSLIAERQNPELAAAVRLAQSAVDPTPSQQVELRQNIEKASGRIRGLQATAAEHEQNIEALKKELGALKP